MSPAANPVILIVDDAAENLHVLYELLRPHYRVLAANSGEVGLRVAHSEPTPDLILLDVMMPGMDGYAVLAKLREASATRDIPVVFLTALADAGDIRALAHLAETRDTETGNHIMRTQGYVQRLAVGLRQHPRFAATLTERYIDLLSRSAPLHDIGKVGIPDYILLKPGKLNADEWAIMQTHAALGSDAIEQAEVDIEMPLAFLATAKEIAHWHHEKWDGSGYPDRLAGEAIPVSARLMAIADVFDALISVRPYKTAMSYDQAREIIAAGRGTHFDPDVTDAFLAGFDDFVAIAMRYLDSGALPAPSTTAPLVPS
ncbi:MAG: response regulator receiver modulated metal dependent phosphohydrolase [Proteobacteria bacterium]|nr:response regulator receiver modulated metal dependent phosphohydrolase [Pseudomonadota bacterium]